MVLISSCNDDEIYKKEQFKTVFALISEDGYNIYQDIHDLENPKSVGNIAASCGGTRPTKIDINVDLSLDIESLNLYNQANFDMNTDMYAKLLPANNYEIESWKLTIPKGERGGVMPIIIKPDGLSPDSTYFIPIKIDSYSDYELNKEKSNVLYQVLIKNKYATQEFLTSYRMSAIRNGTRFTGSKIMHPISKNKVRIFPSDVPFESEHSLIEAYGIILEITEENKVKISSYKDLEVSQIDGDEDYPNIFFVEETGYSKFNTFLISYKYKAEGKTIEMKEELRLEIKEKI